MATSKEWAMPVSSIILTTSKLSMELLSWLLPLLRGAANPMHNSPHACNACSSLARVCKMGFSGRNCVAEDIPNCPPLRAKTSSAMTLRLPSPGRATRATNSLAVDCATFVFRKAAFFFALTSLASSSSLLLRSQSCWSF